MAPEVDVADIPLITGDRFIFCSDGVTRMIADQELREIVGATDDPAAISRGLVTLSVTRGGPDNSTVVAVVVDMP